MGISSRLFRFVATATLALLSVVSAHAAGGAASYADARKAFQEAYSRTSGDVAESPANDSEILKSYPLYPYLEAARIRQALNGDPESLGPVDKRAEDFIAAYAQTPVARGLRRAWLDSLARRSQWGLFVEAYKDSAATESARCQSFVARIELGKTDGLVADISKQWLTPRSLPDCDRPFAWLKDNGALTADLIERRARLALENDNAAFARQLIPALPADRAASLSQWASLLENPARTIDSLIASPETAADEAAQLAGWTRLVRTDVSRAKDRYDRFVRARGLTYESTSRYALALALGLAWNRDPAALDYFARVAPRDLDDAALEWRARAALWAKDWTLVSKSIAAMSQTNQQTARWHYWAARSSEQLHDRKHAREIYESLLAEDNYYSAMAGARLKRSVVPHPQNLPVDADLLATVEQSPAMERARELFLCGMRPEALAEWQLAYESLSDEARKQSIHLAARWGWYDQAVAVASAQHVFNDYVLLYPRPFDAEVSAAARLAQLAPEIVYGVVRQESLYRIDAVSTAGARGLMQLQLDTARRTARYWKRPLPAITDLFDPGINTTLGAARLRMLLDQFDGQIPIALAGYNAGPNAVTRWLPNEPMDSDIWIENIPYNETRGYVQRILWHDLMFTWLRRDGEAQQTVSWLTPIRPLRGTLAHHGLMPLAQRESGHSRK